MLNLLKEFEAKSPHIVFEWKDTETEAEGWVVINSLRGGAAGGGTRMRKGLDRREVESLAKTMEIKFTVSGPAIGGAKSGINFDPKDPRKRGVLERWFKAVYPLLKSYYGTGGDLNIDAEDEVIGITEQMGLWHPQEGVVNGHLKATKPQKIRKIGQLRAGVVKVLEDPSISPLPARKYTVEDLITGWGVAESVRAFYHLHGQDLKNKKVLIQGWGNVAAGAGYYLSRNGAKIVGILDKDGGIFNYEGFSFEEIRRLFINRKNNTLTADHLESYEVANQKFWDVPADIFIPAAASRLVTENHLDRLQKAGVKLISCGANVPFSDKEIFMGPISRIADERFSVIPDFIANCGMARVFAYLMGEDVEITDEAIFQDVSLTIWQALEAVNRKNSTKTKISETALSIALEQLL